MKPLMDFVTEDLKNKTSYDQLVSEMLDLQKKQGTEIKEIKNDIDKEMQELKQQTLSKT